MDFIGYRSDALGAAVDLVNAVIEDPEGTVPDQLRGVLVAHSYRALDAPDSIEPALRAWARRLRTVFDVSTDGETGLLAHFDEHEIDAFRTSLAEAVNALLADPARAAAMGEAGRARAEREFSWRQAAARTVEIYRALS